MDPLRHAMLAIAIALAGCANVQQSVPPGAPEAVVLQQMGQPTAIYPAASGKRLQYATGPFGRQTWNVDLDGAGRVTAVTQALDASALNRLSGQQLTTADITRELGPPAIIDKVASFSGDVWTWRYWEIGTARFFHAYVDREGRVVRMLSTDEPGRKWSVF